MSIIKSEEYMTTGQFAKFCDTTKETILHYRRKKLLIPNCITESGYCYYSPYQYYDYYSVRSLQSAGLSIKEITDIMLSSGGGYVDRLQESREKICKRIEEEIRLLQQAQKTISHEAAQLDSVRIHNLGEPFLENTEGFSFLATSANWGEKGGTSEIIRFKKHVETLTESNLQYDMSMMFAFDPDTFFDKKHPYPEYYICSRLTESSDKLHCLIRPEGTYATFYCRWPWDDLDEHFDALRCFADSMELKTIGLFYVSETTGQISMMPHDNNNLIRITVKVENKDI